VHLGRGREASHKALLQRTAANIDDVIFRFAGQQRALIKGQCAPQPCHVVRAAQSLVKPSLELIDVKPDANGQPNMTAAELDRATVIGDCRGATVQRFAKQIYEVVQPLPTATAVVVRP
jgi:hypothetical protein